MPACLQTWTAGQHGPQGLRHEQCEYHVNDKKADDHCHAREMQNACCLEPSQQGDQTGELDRLPDREPGDHLGDARKDDDDVKQLLDRVINGDVFVRDLEVERFNDGLYDLGGTDR